MSLDEVLSRLEQNYDKDIRQRVLNVYHWGSRVYGTHTPKSDYDFVIVTSHNTKEENLPLVLGKPKVNAEEIDKPYPMYDDEFINCIFIPLENWKFMLWTHKHEALECYFLPPRFKLLETAQIPFELDYEVLRRTVAVESKVRWRTAERQFVEVSEYTGRKFLFHSLRYRIFAMHLIREGKLIDYSIANELWERIKAHEGGWNQLVKDFTPDLQQLREEFHQQRHYFGFYGTSETKRHFLSAVIGRSSPIVPDTLPSSFGSSSLETLRQLSEKGFDSLLSSHSLTAVSHSRFPSLVLFRTSWYSQCNSQVEKECGGSGLLVDLLSGKVVQWGLPHISHWDETDPLAPQLEMPLKAYPHLDGLYACLYSFEGQWFLSNGVEPDEPQVTIAFKDETPLVFSTAFWALWNKLGYSLPSDRSW